jgi:hypothetical protein
MSFYSSLRKAWLRALEHELADVLSADEVDQVFAPHFEEALTILRSVEGSSRAERRTGIERVMAFTELDFPEPQDVPIAAARRAVRVAAADLVWLEVVASSVERRATSALNDLDARLATVEAAYVTRARPS